jgi:hypothetical protein
MSDQFRVGLYFLMSSDHLISYSRALSHPKLDRGHACARTLINKVSFMFKSPPPKRVVRLHLYLQDGRFPSELSLPELGVALILPVGTGSMLNLLPATDPARCWASFGLTKGLEPNSPSKWCSRSSSESSIDISISASPAVAGALAFEEALCCARDDGRRLIVGLLLLCTAREEGDLMVPRWGDE